MEKVDEKVVKQLRMLVKEILMFERAQNALESKKKQANLNEQNKKKFEKSKANFKPNKKELYEHLEYELDLDDDRCSFREYSQLTFLNEQSDLKAFKESIDKEIKDYIDKIVLKYWKTDVNYPS